MVADGKTGVFRGDHFAHAQRAHHLAKPHWRDIGLAFVHPAAHGWVQGQIQISHQHLTFAGFAHRYLFEGEVVTADCSDWTFAEQEAAVALCSHDSGSRVKGKEC
ncbi:hypothetical protein D3C78_1495880 [compost metagenome]